MGGATFATYTKRKAPALILLCIPLIVGCVILLCIPHEKAHKAPLLVGYYLVSGSSCKEIGQLLSFQLGWRIDKFELTLLAPLIYSWSTQNTAGETKKKTTTAMLFIGQSAGNVSGQIQFWSEPLSNLRCRSLVRIFIPQRKHQNTSVDSPLGKLPSSP